MYFPPPPSLSQVSHIHRGRCASLSVSQNGRYLLTTGDSVLKVWDYRMTLDLNFQVSRPPQWE